MHYNNKTQESCTWNCRNVDVRFIMNTYTKLDCLRARFKFQNRGCYFEYTMTVTPVEVRTQVTQCQAMTGHHAQVSCNEEKLLPSFT